MIARRDGRDAAAPWIVAVILAGATLRLAIAGATGFQADDALITYRYADNLAAGIGFVYNDGERVYGTTTPLLTLLLALARLAGIAPAPAALAIGILASAAASVLAVRLVPAEHGAVARVAAASGPAFLPASVLWSVSGMETALFAASLLAVAAAFVERRGVALGAALALAMLVRFDGVVAGAAVAAGSAWLALRDPAPASASRREAALLAQAAATAIALTAPWFAFAWIYFGDPVPQSIWAKLALYAGAGFDRSDPLAVVVSALRVSEPAGPGEPTAFALVESAFGAAALAAVALRRDRRAIVAALAIAYVAFYAASRTHVHPWYLAPPRILLWSALALAVADFAARLAIGRSWRIGGVALGGLAIALAGAWAWAHAAAYAAMYERAHAEIGRRLAQHSRPGETVYAWDIGYVGYLSRRRVLDFVGIVSPEIVPFNRERRFADAIERFAPEWLVVGLYHGANEMILAAPAVARGYRLVWRVGDPDFAGWALDDPRRRDRFVPEYAVLRRADLPMPAAP